MPVYGADVDDLRTLSKLFLEKADELEGALRMLTARIDDTAVWRGSDAERFRGQWAGRDSALIRSVTEAMRGASATLERNASDQESTSAAGTMTGDALAHTGGAANSVCTATSTADLYTRLRNNPDPDKDGVSIDRVVGADNQTRYVVYFEGTGGAGDGQEWSIGDRLSWYANAGKMNGIPDEYLFGRLDGIPAGAEVMFVGYSQGGLDAQTIAASGRFNVTDVVTFGSPRVLNLAPQNLGINMLNLEAFGDPVPMATPFSVVPGNLETSISNWIAPLTNSHQGDVEAFNVVAGNGRFLGDLHDSADTYELVGDQYDRSDDPRFADIRASMARYQGESTTID